MDKDLKLKGYNLLTKQLIFCLFLFFVFIFTGNMGLTTVYAANPVVSSLDGDILNYTEGQKDSVTPALLDAGSDAAITADSWNGGRLKIEFSAGSTASEDSLYFSNSGTGTGQIQAGYINAGGTYGYGNYVTYSGTMIGSWTSGGGYSGNPINITFNENATNEAVTALIRNLHYSDSETYYPSTSTRTVLFTFTDSNSLATTASTTINFTSVNDSPEFIGAGFIAKDFGAAAAIYGTGYAVAQQADGKYLVVYSIYDCTSSTSHIAIARYNYDGTLDLGFGTNGVYHSTVGNASPSNNIKDILIRSDVGNEGKIVVSSTDSVDGDDSIVLFQLTSEGALDSSFGSSGVCRYNMPGGSQEEISAITQQSDGEFVAVGDFYSDSTHNRDIVLWRFKADGSGLDTDFNSSIGYSTVCINSSYSYGYDVVVLPSGNIVVTGLVQGSNNTTDSWDFGVRCYTKDGVLDTSFGESGMAQLDYADTHEGRPNIAMDSTGKLVIAGSYNNSSSGYDIAVTRLNSNGSIDTGFGPSSNGWMILDVSENNSDTIYDMKLDADDNIIMAGPMGGTAAVVRLTADGSLDTTFGSAGKVLLSDMGEYPNIYGLCIDSNGKLLVTGDVSNTIYNPLAYSTDAFGALVRLNSDGSMDTMGSNNYTERKPAIVLDGDMQVYDGELDATNYNGATLTVSRNGGSNAEDVFSATGTLSAIVEGSSLTLDGTTIGTITTNSKGTLLLTFNSNATNALVNKTIRQICYSNSSTIPPASVTIDMTLNDNNTGVQGTGGVLSDKVSFTIGITDVPSDSDSTVTEGTTVTEPVAITTTAAAASSAVDVFDFTITDKGTSDTLSTDITKVIVNTSGTGDFSKVNWRLSGPDADNVIGTYSLTDNSITFGGLTISVADKASETYKINAYYSNTSGIAEGQIFKLSVDASSTANITAANTGSLMSSTQTAVTNGTGSIVGITATKLVFSTQPTSSVSGVSMTQPVVVAADDYGNVDSDYSGSITLSLSGTSTGSLSGNVSTNAASGIATFSDLLYTATNDGESFKLTAASDSLASADSASVTSDVVATKLVFVTQPAPLSLLSGQASDFTTVPVLQAVDASGKVDTGYIADIVLSITKPDGSAAEGTVNSLSCDSDTDASDTTATKAAVGGEVTLTGLAVQYTVGGSDNSNTIAIKAASGTLTGVSSNSITAISAPSISSVTSASSSKTYKPGETVSFTAVFSKAVNVINTVENNPYIQISLDSGKTAKAYYKDGSGTNTITFAYTVGDGEEDTDGITLVSPIALNGSQIKDSSDSSLDAALSFTASTISDIKVDGIAPALSSVTISSDNLSSTAKAKVGDTVTLHITANENIAEPTVTIAEQPATVDNAGDSESYTWNASYVLQDGDAEGTLVYSIVFSDTAGNAGVNVAATTDTSSIVFDKTAPSGYAAAIDNTAINNTNYGNLSFTISNAENGSLYDYEITSSTDTSKKVTGNGTITSATQQITGIDTSSLLDGTLTLSVTLTDSTGNKGIAATDVAKAKDTVAPVIEITGPSATTTKGESITYTVTYSGEDSISLSKENITLIKTGTAQGTITVSGTESTRTVTIGEIKGEGTLGISLEAGTAADNAGNKALAASASSNITVDCTAPSISISSPSVSVTAGGSITYMVTYAGEDSITLSNTDITLNTTGDATGTVEVTGTGSMRTVAINGVSGDGTLSISIAEGTASDSAGNKALSAGPSSEVIVDNTAPTGGKVSINTGAQYTNSSDVTLSLSAVDAVFMMLSEKSDFSDVADYETYADSKNFALSTGDGVKTIYAKFKDAVGNETTETISNAITLDTQGPTGGTLSINSGALYSNSNTIILNLSVTGAVYMKVSENSSFTGTDYEAYAGSKSFDLSTGDGIKTVYVRYSDEAGNETAETISGTITLDSTAPTLSISEPSAIVATSKDQITYVITYSGSDTINLLDTDISLNKTGTVSASVYAAGTSNTRTVVISGITGNGTLGISIASGTATDNAGNKALAASSATFKVDNSGPSLSISAPSASITADSSVTYTVSYSNESAISLSDADIIINKTGSADGTIAVSGTTGSTRTVTISNISGDGTLGFSIAAGTASDDAGNTALASGPSKTFTVDNTAPQGTVIINNNVDYMTSNSVTLSITSYDSNGSGVGKMRFCVNNGSWSPWEAINTAKSGVLEVPYGVVTVKMELMDNAGNISSTIISDSILYKFIPTVDGSTKTGTEDTKMYFTVSDFVYNSDGAGLSKIRIASLPLNGTLILNGTNITELPQEIDISELGNLAYVPEKNWNGIASFNWLGFDGTLWTASKAAMTLNILPTNDAPVAVGANISTDVDVPVKGILQASDLDGDTLTYQVVTQGTKGILTITDSGNGAFVYTSKAGEKGNDTVTFRVYDSKEYSDIAVININIIPAGVADLGYLGISGGSLSPAFDANIITYTANVSHSTDRITITAGISNKYSTLKIDDTLVTVSDSVYQGSKIVDLDVGSNTITIEVIAQDSSILKTYTLTITRAKKSSNNDNDKGSGNGNDTKIDDTNTNNPDTSASTNSGVDILVNGETETAGTATSGTNSDGKTVTTITLDQDKLEQKLEEEGSNAAVTIPVKTDSDIIVGELNGQMVKSMEAKEAVLVVKNESVTYTLPAQQINIAEVSAQIGSQVELKDIKVSIEIAKVSDETAKIVESSAKKGEFTIVAPPMEFTIKCTSGDKTVNVSSFNAYVERTIAIPEGVDADKITTGVVIEADGTVRHVPTQIIKIGEKYYAKINSLSNSTYSVIWHPLEFSDMANHWAKEEVNDMGSRMVVSGSGNNMYEPDRDITRAEFAAIVVKALGLKPGAGENPFADVKASEWYTDYIKTAYSNNIICGYDASTFGPMDKITREEAMTMIARMMNITGLKVELGTGEVQSLLEGFSDFELSSDWAEKSIALCLKSEIVSGRENDMLAPNDSITRAEVAVIVKRLLQKSGLI